MSPSSRLVEGAPARAVAVYAHPDDADVSSGGTLARWADEGCEVHVVLCTTGDKGTVDPSADPRALVRKRADEVEEARALLGVREVHSLGNGDGELENDLATRAALVRIVRSIRPEALVCPDPLAVFFGEHYYNHRDHRIVGFAALDAAAPAAASPLYFPEAGPAHSIDYAYLSGSLEPSVYVDVTRSIDRKAMAVLCHRSQLGEAGEHFGPIVRERAKEAGRAVGVEYAEAFRLVRLSQ